MTHNDSQHLRQLRYHWKKEQQLIRKKYQIPYSMTFTMKSCSSQSDSQLKSLRKDAKTITIHDDRERKTPRRDKTYFNMKNNDSKLPPMYCTKCHLHLTNCSCPDGLGQWWKKLQKTYEKSSISSISERHMGSNSSLTDILSSDRTKSKHDKQLYVLLDWKNRQSLINFLRTINYNEKLSTLTIEQLRELITKNDRILLFNSMVDLALSLNTKQRQALFCHIYIDPSYYLTIQGMIPSSQSERIADNTDLNHTLQSIQKLAILLGIKMDQSVHINSKEKPSPKQRKSLLEQQTNLIASKIPYNTIR